MNKYQIVKNEYEQIKSDLNQPGVINNVAKLKTLSKRCNELESIINDINEFEKNERQLAEANETIASETDSDLLTIAQQDLEVLGERQIILSKKIDQDLKPKDPIDQKDTIVEIRAGTGGDEAALFAAQLFRMYSRYAERMNWKTKILNANPTG